MFCNAVLCAAFLRWICCERLSFYWHVFLSRLMVCFFQCVSAHHAHRSRVAWITFVFAGFQTQTTKNWTMSFLRLIELIRLNFNFFLFGHLAWMEVDTIQSWTISISRLNVFFGASNFPVEVELLDWIESFLLLVSTPFLCVSKFVPWIPSKEKYLR